MDVVQEALEKALRALPSLRQPEYMKTWFYRILVNESLTYLRKNKRVLLPLQQALEEIARFDICRRHGIIVAESAADKTLPPLSSPYSIYREYRYGKIKLTVYHRNED